jgi:hypothetical protein
MLALKNDFKVKYEKLKADSELNKRKIGTYIIVNE